MRTGALSCAWLSPQYLEGMLNEKYVLNSKSTSDSMDILLLDLDCCRLITCLMPPRVAAFVLIKVTLSNYSCNVRVTLEIYKYRG